MATKIKKFFGRIFRPINYLGVAVVGFDDGLQYVAQGVPRRHLRDAWADARAIAKTRGGQPAILPVTNAAVSPAALAPGSVDSWEHCQEKIDLLP